MNGGRDASTAEPATGGTGPLTVDEAVSLALRQNPSLSAAAREVVAARLGVRSAAALSNPEFVFAPSVIGKGGSDEELIFRQPLEINGTRAARRGIAEAELRQRRALAVVELRNLVFNTKSAYYELARGQELLTLQQDLLRVAEQVDAAVYRLVEEGARPPIDRTRTQIEVTRARQQVSAAQGQTTTALATLNALLGRAADTAAGTLAPADPQRETIDREEALRRALESRAEITADQALRQSLLQQARLVRAQGRPDIAPQARAGGVVRGVSNAGIAISVDLPVIDYGYRRNRVRQLREQARAQGQRVEATRNRVAQEVEAALGRFLAADAVVREFQQGILDQARQLLEAARLGFQEGAADFNVIALLDAQRTYRGVLTDYTNALIARATARAEVERATAAVPAAGPEGAGGGEKSP